MTEKLYLEDFYPGQKFSTQSALVTEAEIKEFAQKFDPQPFHLDDDDARATLFGGLSASGWHTATITMRLNVTSGPNRGHRSLTALTGVRIPYTVHRQSCPTVKRSMSRSSGRFLKPTRHTVLPD
jgi:acyl dehydratase